MSSTRAIAAGGALVVLVTLTLTLVHCGDESAPATGGGGTGTPFVFLNPIVTTKVGDWVRYELENGDEMSWEVVKVNPLTHHVTVIMETRSRESKKLVGSEVHIVKPNDFFLWGESAGMVVARVRMDRVIELGEVYDALSVVTAGGVAGQVESWYSQKVPIMGLIRRTALLGSGKMGGAERVVLKLVEMGRAE